MSSVAIPGFAVWHLTPGVICFFSVACPWIKKDQRLKKRCYKC